MLESDSFETAKKNYYYTPRKLCLWEGILFSLCPNGGGGGGGGGGGALA